MEFYVHYQLKEYHKWDHIREVIRSMKSENGENILARVWSIIELRRNVLSGLIRDNFNRLKF
jgi:hypothetical protein